MFGAMSGLLSGFGGSAKSSSGSNQGWMPTMDNKTYGAGQTTMPVDFHMPQGGGIRYQPPGEKLEGSPLPSQASPVAGAMQGGGANNFSSMPGGMSPLIQQLLARYNPMSRMMPGQGQAQWRPQPPMQPAQPVNMPGPWQAHVMEQPRDSSYQTTMPWSFPKMDTSRFTF